jgi:hypothetical protein
VRHPAVGELDPEALHEVLLVIVEGGDRRPLGGCDRDTDLELELLLALARSQHPAGAAEERVAGHFELGVEPHATQDLDRAIAPRVAPGGDGRGLADSDHLALVEHLQASRVARRLAAEDVGAAGVDRRPAGGQRTARGDRGIDRVARGGHKHEVRHRLIRSPVVVPSR